MPLANPVIKTKKKDASERVSRSEEKTDAESVKTKSENREFLEVDPTVAKTIELQCVSEDKKNAPYKPLKLKTTTDKLDQPKSQLPVELPDDLPPLDDFGI